jgi:hypothetical protein
MNDSITDKISDLLQKRGIVPAPQPSPHFKEVDSDAKCNLGRSGSPRKDTDFPSSPPPSDAFRRCEGGAEERKIE